MVEGFSLKSAHLFGDALASQARLRFRVFVEHRMLDHHHYDGMEYDEFDTPAALYLVWRDDAGTVRGLLRMLPTTLPYMIESYWPFLISSGDLPKTERIWEVTRVCVDRSFDSKLRRYVMPELLCAMSEFCEQYSIDSVIGVARPHLTQFLVRGGVQWLGESAEIEGHQERAFRIQRQHLWPSHHCERLGISGPVLSFNPIVDWRIAA